MGDVIGLGLTHYPLLALPDDRMGMLLDRTLTDPDIPEEAKDPASWPAAMRDEWADDKGAMAAAGHREHLERNFRRLKQRLDAFDPELVVIFGDDQYENFQEDCVPAFSVLAFDEVDLQPWNHRMGTPNVWDEPSDFRMRVPGHHEAGKYLATELLLNDVDVTYAYKPLHKGWGHAFANTIAFLDADRQGWNYPTVAVPINCYGRRLVVQRGSSAPFAEEPAEVDFDPPSPTPRRCLEVGRRIGRAVANSPWRTALIASSSWSHAFLTNKTWRLHPDMEADRQAFEALRDGNHAAWQARTLTEIEESGQQEMLNWFCLVGAMDELGLALNDIDYVETYVFNSNKCFAYYE